MSVIKNSPEAENPEGASGQRRNRKYLLSLSMVGEMDGKEEARFPRVNKKKDEKYHAG